MIKISKKFNSVIKRYIVIAFEYNLEIRILKIYLRKEKIGNVFDKYPLQNSTSLFTSSKTLRNIRSEWVDVHFSK